MYPKLKINVYFIFLNIGDLTFGITLVCMYRRMGASLAPEGLDTFLLILGVQEFIFTKLVAGGFENSRSPKTGVLQMAPRNKTAIFAYMARTISIEFQKLVDTVPLHAAV
jgi:hypothetical protein